MGVGGKTLTRGAWKRTSAPKSQAAMALRFPLDVHLDVPEEFARRLASDKKGFARAALEALAAEGVRSGKLSVFQARTLLGIQSRYEMDGVKPSSMTMR